MINNTGQRLFVVAEQDGEILLKVEQGESFNVRSKAQTKHDKWYSPKVKIKGRFFKVMFTEKKVRDMLKDNTATYFALNVMRDYLVPNFNVLLKNGKKFKGVDLAEEMGITRQSAMAHIKKLKELNIIAEVETENKGKLWAINPDYYFLGEECPEAVLKAFERKKK